MSDNGTAPATPAEHGEEIVGTKVKPQMDLGALLEGAIGKAVAAQINAQAKEIAEGVVADMLTPEVIAGMRETAILETERALNPAPEPEPEPEPESESAGGEPAEEVEEPRELCYATLKDFVEVYVVNIYRREVSVRGSEKMLRWCPCWWDHGEVVARLRALWRAFEHLRLGETTENAAWWLVYFDPMMERIFDPQGPFKYCSVADGHKRKMPALPVEPADPRLFEEDSDYDPVSATGFVVPVAAAGRRRTVMTVDEDANIVRWPEFPGE